MRGSLKWLLIAGCVCGLLTSRPLGVGAQPVDPFTLTQTPPADVPAVVQDSPSALPSCPTGSTVPGVAVLPSSVELGTTYHVCLQGFGAGQDVALSISRPDGQAPTVVLTTDGGGNADWVALAAAGTAPDPFGAYAVTASQAGVTASTAFSMVAPTAPHVTVYPVAGPPGTEFQVIAVGGAELMPLSLYRRDAVDAWRFATPLALNGGREFGNGSEYVLISDRATPVNSYLVRADAAPGAAATLDVRPPATTAPTASPTRPLKHRDVPSGATAAQLAFGAGGGNGPGMRCVIPADGERESPFTSKYGFEGCNATMGDWFDLAFAGFAPNRDLVVRVTQPDGSVRTQVVSPRTADDSDLAVRDPGDAFQFYWPTYNTRPSPPDAVDDWVFGLLPVTTNDPRPSDAYGVYQVDVVQGSLHGSGQYTLGPASVASLKVEAERVPPGKAVHLQLVGYPAGQPVALHLYQQTESRVTTLGRYITTVYTPPTDALGNVAYEIPTEADDQPAHYVIQSEPRAVQFWTALQFQVTTEPNLVLIPPERTLQNMVFATIGESDHVWANVIAQQPAPIGELDRFYVGQWLSDVRGVVQRLQASGNYRAAHLNGLKVTRVAELDDGRIEALASEDWDDRELSADGTLVRDRSGTLDQRYVFERVDDRWLITESELVRR